MKLPRTALLSALRAAKPALAEGTNQLEALSHFWFDGELVSAFDGTLGIQVKLKTDFKGGVLGAKLLSVLEKSESTDISLTKSDDDNLVLSGESGDELFEQIKFALRPITEWFWAPPVPQVPEVKLDDDFIKAVRSLLFSVGSGKVLSPKERGLTFVQYEDALDMYSTDLHTLSWVTVEPGQPVLTADNRAVVPTLFCEQLSKFKENARLRIDTMGAYLEGDIKVDEEETTSVVMYVTLIEEDAPLQVEIITEKFDAAEDKFDIPARMRSSLDQAVVLIGDGQPLEVNVGDNKKGGYLKFLAQSPFGHFDDEIPYEGEHPRIKVKVDASLLRRGIEGRKKLSVTKSCVVTTGPGNFVHIIATK